jgi:hypothetical protein
MQDHQLNNTEIATNIPLCYGLDDSREVRAAFFSCRKKTSATRRLVITKKQWDAFKKLGVDMANFITLQDLRKVARDQQAKQMKLRQKP